MRGCQPGGHLVVGVDGSEGGRRALAWAVGQAQATGQRCVAVCAVEFGFATVERYAALVLDDLRAARRAMLDEEVGRLGAGRAVDARVVVGQAADVLVEASAGAALLVVGPGRGASLGPVSAACVRRARCPVVIARPPDPPPPARRRRAATARACRPGQPATA